MNLATRVILFVCLFIFLEEPFTDSGVCLSVVSTGHDSSSFWNLGQAWVTGLEMDMGQQGGFMCLSTLSRRQEARALTTGFAISSTIRKVI